MAVNTISKNKQIDILQFLELMDRPDTQFNDKQLLLKKDGKIKNKNSASTFDKQMYFIENAGLIILHPFLQKLFSNLHYIENNNFVNDEIQRRATLLTQYLLIGETEIPEYQLLLNKILCGYPIFNTVEYELQLTIQEKKETEELLLSVIEYWTALKNTSIDGLRNSFLQRPGKLSELKDGWLLQVEQKSYDVLMNYLPWGIGMIKLPWMKNLLRVEWIA